MEREEFIRQSADNVAKSCMDCGYENNIAYECACAYADGMRYADNHPKSPWITYTATNIPKRVDEEYPYSAPVFVTVDNDTMSARRAIYDFESGRWLQDKADAKEITSVTHWMYIPTL